MPSNNSLMNGAPPHGNSPYSRADHVDMDESIAQRRAELLNEFGDGPMSPQNGHQQNGHGPAAVNGREAQQQDPAWLRNENQRNTDGSPPNAPNGFNESRNGFSESPRNAGRAPNAGPPQRRGASVGDDDYYAGIDHEAKAMRLKETNPNKYRQLYGDSNMRYHISLNS